MRLAYFSITALIICGFAAGYLLLSSQQRVENVDPLVSYQQVRNDFLESHSSKLILNWYHTEQSLPFELRDLKTTVPMTALAPVEMTALYNYSQTCEEKRFHPGVPSVFKKAWEWEEFICGRRKELTANFFSRAPFMHPAGVSFALIAIKNKPEIFAKKEWFIPHASYFHLSEWQNLPTEWVSAENAWKPTLSRRVIRSLALSDPLALSDDTVAFKVSNGTLEKTGLEVIYQVYDRKVVVSYFKEHGLILSNEQPNLACGVVIGNACISEDRSSILNQFRAKSMIAFIFLTTLGLLIGAGLLRSLKSQDEQTRQTKLAFQVLAHELRTPLASLVFHGDTLRNSYDSLLPEAQEALLLVLNDIQRLVRVTETSKRFIGNNPESSVVAVDSIRGFLKEVLSDPAFEKVVLLSGSDFAGSLDAVSIRLILQNLLRNAVTHGRGPVEVSVQDIKNRVMISVSDQGVCEFKTLSQMKKSFTKGSQSQGLGLGLAIIDQLLAGSKMHLEFESKPKTRFILWLSEDQMKPLQRSFS